MNLLKDIRISVIIPVYNREYIVSRAIQSVLQQSFKGFELIIVDDGSTDKLEEVLKACSDPRLKIIKHPRNKGAAAARNTGIKAARGDLLAFLDSDDEWCSTKLEEQLNHLDASRKKNEHIMGSFTWFFLHRQNGLVELRHFTKVKNWRKYFLQGCFISPGSTLLMDKNVYEDIGFYDESLTRLEDWDWLLRFSKKFDLAIYEQPLSHIHQGDIPSYHGVFAAIQAIIQKHKKGLSFYENINLISSGQIELFYTCKRTSFFKASRHFFFALAMNPFLLKKVARVLVTSLFFRKG